MGALAADPSYGGEHIGAGIRLGRTAAMRVRRNLAALLAVVLAGPLLLSACGGGGSSVADPPVSSPPSTPPTSEPPARETPQHFIRRWAREDTAIQRTGNTALFRDMSAGCRGCIQLADLVDKIYSAGGFIHTKGWQVRRISITKHGSADLFVFSPPTTYSESAGGVLHHLQAGNAHFQLHIEPNGDSWTVSSLVQVAS
jgi:hypothetical protein